MPITITITNVTARVSGTMNFKVSFFWVIADTRFDAKWREVVQRESPTRGKESAENLKIR